MVEEDAATKGDGARDAVDGILDQWRRERPDLDLAAMGTFARLSQLSLVLTPSIERTFAQHGLRQGEFDVLAALRRSGPPYTLTPSRLADSLMMTRAGMTNRIDRLEAAGFVERSLDPADRRSFRVRLTDEGRRVADAALTAHAANVRRLLSYLDSEQRRSLDEALRHLLRNLEPPDADRAE